jgi:glutamine amidotransferase
MRAALIDYGSGNIASAAKALSRAAAESSGHAVIVTADPDLVRKCERIVLPGVGAFADCMRGLSAVPGMIEALNESVIRNGRPILGICVGMQLMATAGREFGVHNGLNWIGGEVAPLSPADPALKIPHMGWNEIELVRNHPVFAELDENANAYFVHSFEMKPATPAHLLATTD